jgi:predicted ATPase
MLRTSLGPVSDAGFDERPVRRIQRRPNADYDPQEWPYTLPPVAQLLSDGLDLEPGVTFLVGENGSGKSTLVEAIAAAAGINAEGGTSNAMHSTRISESPLREALQLVRSVGAPRWSYFLRAESMHGHYTYLEDVGPGRTFAPPAFHEMSHGQSFLGLLDTYFNEPGFYLLDEPESALSFSSCLALVGVLDELARAGSQVICATHSPILTALPGATILQVDEVGYGPVEWADLELVDHFKRYLGNPMAYLRHVLD